MDLCINTGQLTVVTLFIWILSHKEKAESDLPEPFLKGSWESD